jgi:hypothetical protein
MAYLIGTDEAGYGPNLGPLAISATVWRVPDRMLRRDLYEVLSDCVCNAVSRQGDDARLAIADSKQLYQPGGGLALLECGVLASLRVTGRAASRWREVWTRLDPACGEFLAAVPWHADYDAELPCDVDPAHLSGATERFGDGLQRARVELIGMRSAAIFPLQWNELLDEHDNKASALSYCTLTLVRDLVAAINDEPILIVCDKHGGRNRYAGLLQHFFPDDFIETRGEGRAVSIYQWGQAPRRIEARFLAQGESFLPSALASMTSKYLRELAMAAFNAFWLRQSPALKPTAGYPGDARRFKNEIAELQSTLGITDRQLWRNR